MNEIWIAPIFAILGTALGVSIPSIAKYLENKSSHSKEKKEKYELITRKIITEFVPKLKHSLFLANNYLKNKEHGLVAINSSEIASDKINEVQVFYLIEIKPHYPLEMHSKIAAIIDEINGLSMDINFDNSDDNSTNPNIYKTVDRCTLLIQDMIKHIEKKYI